MPQFKFCFHLESKMSAAAPASSLPWSGPPPHCMRLRRNPPLPSLSLCLSLSYSLDAMSFLFLQTNPFPHCFFPSFIIYHDLFHLEMICFVWEICVFAHLPSCWMLLNDCSRLLDLLTLSPVDDYRTGDQHKAQSIDMLLKWTNLDRSSHVGQADSNPPDAANCLLLHKTLRKYVQPCAISHTKQVGGVTNLKSKLKGDMSVSFLLVTLRTWFGGLRRHH